MSSQSSVAYSRELMMLPNLERLRWIVDHAENRELTPQQTNECLAAWWPLANGPSAGLGIRRTVHTFKYAGFVIDTPGTQAPATPVKLYRGAGVTNWAGMSWTNDIE